MTKKILSVLAALVLVLGFAGIALADDGAFDDFKAQYPGKSYGCNLCHTSSPPALNPYGTALKGKGATANNITAAMFIAVEPLDSDSDGATDLEEINAGTRPGDATDVPPPPVAFEVTAPAEGESVPTGAAYAVTWTAATGAASYKVKLSIDGGLTWSTLGTGLSATTVSWNVPNTIKKNISKAIIKVIAYNATNQKLGVAKSGTFSIDVLTITVPTAGQIVPQNAPFNITWTANGTAVAPDQVVVKYSLNNGTTWKPAQGTLGASSFSWTVPAVSDPKTKAKVKVILKAVGNTVARAESAKFTVQ